MAREWAAIGWVLFCVVVLMTGPVLAQDNNSCQWANDGECDDGRYQGAVTSACAAGTDANDCRGLPLIGGGGIVQGNDSCEWARDGDCDDGQFVGAITNLCAANTDATDCRGLQIVDLGGAIPENDSCLYAFDNECDDPRYQGAVTDACPVGTDATDCRATGGSAGGAVVAGGDNSCQWANDNECDETRYDGTGACPDGTDTNDCRGIAQGGLDSCRWANDGECDEPRFGGTGACPDGTDTSDCRGGSGIPAAGTDSCRWSNDLECDELRYGGTGACADGTDYSDCRGMAVGGDNSCEWAFDGECDEFGIGLGVCAEFTDTADCAAVAHLRGRDNSCPTAFNDVCEEPGQGRGACLELTDTADCIGRETIAGVRDHYFGRDDRILVAYDAHPWRPIGLLSFADGECTATLISPNTAVTAAHCFFDGSGRIIPPDAFYAGQNGDRFAAQSAATRYYVNPNYTDDVADLGRGNGDDWAFFELAQPLGNQRGFMTLASMTDAQRQRAQVGQPGILRQAGYSHDTGNHLSGNVGCTVERFLQDGSFLHTCDTTFGDSGSPFFIEDGGQTLLVGIDSQFIDVRGRSAEGYLAVDSSILVPAYETFLAGATTGGRSVPGGSGKSGWVSLD